MMRCPQCGRIFSDAALRFCLYDGRPLVPDTQAPSPRGGTRAAVVWTVFGALGAVLVLIVLLAFARTALTLAGRSRQAARPSPSPQSGSQADLAAAIRRADDAESRSFHDLDPAPLFPCYSGDALQRELTALQSLRRQGVFSEGRLLSQRFGPFALAPDGSEAQVEVSETWSQTEYSVATKQAVRDSPAHVVPQSVHLHRTPSGWVVDHIMAESAPAASP